MGRVAASHPPGGVWTSTKSTVVVRLLWTVAVPRRRDPPHASWRPQTVASLLAACVCVWGWVGGWGRWVGGLGVAVCFGPWQLAGRHPPVL